MTEQSQPAKIGCEDFRGHTSEQLIVRSSPNHSEILDIKGRRIADVFGLNHKVDSALFAAAPALLAEVERLKEQKRITDALLDEGARKIEELRAEKADLVELLEKFAKQKTTGEMDAGKTPDDEDYEDYGDIEYAYDFFIKESRAALAKHKPE